MLIKSIMWDTNNDNEALASLPDEIETPNFLHQEDYKTMDDFFAAVAEWLIYEFGWCHFGFQAIRQKKSVKRLTTKSKMMTSNIFGAAPAMMIFSRPSPLIRGFITMIRMCRL